MNLSSPKTAWRLTLAVSACLIVVIIGYSTFSIVRAMREPDRPPATVPAPDLPDPALSAAARMPGLLPPAKPRFVASRISRT